MICHYLSAYMDLTPIPTLKYNTHKNRKQYPGMILRIWVTSFPPSCPNYLEMSSLAQGKLPIAW